MWKNRLPPVPEMVDVVLRMSQLQFCSNRLTSDFSLQAMVDVMKEKESLKCGSNCSVVLGSIYTDFDGNQVVDDVEPVTDKEYADAVDCVSKAFVAEVEEILNAKLLDVEMNMVDKDDAGTPLSPVKLHAYRIVDGGNYVGYVYVLKPLVSLYYLQKQVLEEVNDSPHVPNRDPESGQSIGTSDKARSYRVALLDPELSRHRGAFFKLSNDDIPIQAAESITLVEQDVMRMVGWLMKKQDVHIRRHLKMKVLSVSGKHVACWKDHQTLSLNHAQFADCGYGFHGDGSCQHNHEIEIQPGKVYCHSRNDAKAQRKVNELKWTRSFFTCQVWVVCVWERRYFPMMWRSVRLN
jgi:hypothetical protein